MKRVQLDLNHAAFQQMWFALPPEDGARVLAALEKLSRLTWNQLYADRGLKWELIHSKSGPHGGRTYSLRVTQKIRAVAYRDGDSLRLLAIHADHDSAYQ